MRSVSFRRSRGESVVRRQLSVATDNGPLTTDKSNWKIMAEAKYSRRCWFTFPSKKQVEQPIIWQMSRKFPEVVFDIRQASVQNELGIMAVLLSGKEEEVKAAMEFIRSKGVTVEPIEKSVIEG